MIRKLYVFLAILMVLSLVSCAGQAAPPAAPTEAPAAEAPAAEAPAEPTEAPAAEAPAASGVTELTIIWAEWDPANYLATLVQDYAEVAGVTVRVVQEPWGSFYDRVSAEWAAQGTAFDLVIGDSQWLGQGATQGHYVDLTEFLTTETGLAETVTPATLKYYAEFPPNSGTYWAFPTEGDADGWAYRKDLFEDPAEMEAFQAEYGYELGIPETWQQLLDISEFFYRPDADPPIYGAAIYTQKDYDAITMGYENVMFSWGADWADENYNVMGVVNSPEAVEALEFYKRLYESGPPGNTNSFFAETNNYFISGQSVLTMNYFAFLPGLANPEINPYAEGTGFFANPAGPNGDRYAALGGQGMSINAYISPERQEAAKAFLEWFGQKDVQAKWAALGGYTCNAEVLESPEFLDVTPFNPAFAETMTMVKDFWNIPEYGELLIPVQRELSAYVVGDQGTAQEALDRVAEEHDQILREAGYIQ